MKSKLKNISQKKKEHNWKKKEEFVKQEKLLSKETMLVKEVSRSWWVEQNSTSRKIKEVLTLTCSCQKSWWTRQKKKWLMKKRSNTKSSNKRRRTPRTGSEKPKNKNWRNTKPILWKFNFDLRRNCWNSSNRSFSMTSEFLNRSSMSSDWSSCSTMERRQSLMKRSTGRSSRGLNKRRLRKKNWSIPSKGSSKILRAV